MTTPAQGPLGRTIREQRLILDLTLRELGRRAQLSESYVWRIEHGERMPERDACVRLAQALQLNPVIVLRLAGFVPEEELEQWTPSGAVRKAILGDPKLNDEQKRALLMTYHSYVPADDSSSSTS